MLMSITLKQQQDSTYKASDLGYLLHKNPSKIHAFELSFGNAYVFYPEESDEKCVATIYGELDGVDIVKNYQGPKGSAKQLKQYVNDRPFTANSFFSVAISRLFGTALNGNCKQQPELVCQALPLQVDVPVMPSRGGETLIRKLFEPLGYQVAITQHQFDKKLPQWGAAPYFKVSLQGRQVLSDLLRHLYVLIPVLDNDKHYWVSFDEVDKLIDKGQGWIPNHPEKNLIVARYLKKQSSLTKKALAAFQVSEASVTQEQLAAEQSNQDGQSQVDEEQFEKRVRLNDLRIQKVVETIQQLNVSTVVDLGCGEGKYLREYLKIKKLSQITGVEVVASTLEKAQQRLKIERLPEKVRQKLTLLQGSLTYKDERLKNQDLATCIEVIEHIDEDRLDAFQESIFGFAQPKHIIITTPNVEFNATFENMPKGKFRHSDHRFEWDRKTFESWCRQLGQKYGYEVSFDGIGERHEEFGTPTQMALFSELAST